MIINQNVSGGGTTPTGTTQITTNGIHDVTNYATADVQVPTTAPAYYIEKSVDANGKLINSSTMIDLTGVTDVGNYVLSGSYSSVNFPANTVVDLSSLVSITGYKACLSMFSSATGITSINLSGLKTINNDGACQFMCNNCSLSSINLSSLTTITGANAFESCLFGCSNLTSLDLSSVTTIRGSSCFFGACIGCQSLTSVNFSSLSIIGGYSCFSTAFRNCSVLTTLSFPCLKTLVNSNMFNDMLQGVTGCTVHLPSNLTSYTFNFGGTNTTVLLDLPATNTLTGADTVTYTRNPKYDTATALAWKVGAYGTTNFTPAYYTSGTTDPAVSDTIYSDAACTTAVTTISSIA